MDNFIVSIGENKKEIKLLNENKLLLDGREYPYSIRKICEYYYLVEVESKIFSISVMKEGENFKFYSAGNYFSCLVRSKLRETADAIMEKKGSSSGKNFIKAPMPGMILKFFKKPGDKILVGDSLFVLEAMKMENEIKSSVGGIIKEIFAKEGKSVDKEEKIVLIE